MHIGSVEMFATGLTPLFLAIAQKEVIAEYQAAGLYSQELGEFLQAVAGRVESLMVEVGTDLAITP